MIPNYRVPQQLGSSSCRDILPAWCKMHLTCSLVHGTRIVSLLLVVSGRSVTKSMEISPHLFFGI